MPKFWRVPLPGEQSNPGSRRDIYRFPDSRTIFWSNPGSRKYPSRPCPDRRLALKSGPFDFWGWRGGWEMIWYKHEFFLTLSCTRGIFSEDLFKFDIFFCATCCSFDSLAECARHFEAVVVCTIVCFFGTNMLEGYSFQNQPPAPNMWVDSVWQNTLYVFACRMLYVGIVAGTLPDSLRIAVTFRSKEKLPRLSMEDTTWRTTLILGLAVSNWISAWTLPGLRI